MNDLREFSRSLRVAPSSLSSSFINAFFLSQTPKEDLSLTNLRLLASNPGLEREKTIWRPTDSSKVLATRWKVFLSCLPPQPEAWGLIDTNKVKQYISLCNQYKSQLALLESENPLESYATETACKEPKNVTDSYLRKAMWEIKKDARRTHFDQSVLENRYVLHKILLIYQLSKGYEYVQGMNELVSILIDVFSETKSGVEREAETFYFFCELMEIMGDWFKDGTEGLRWMKNRCDSIESILETKDEELAMHLKACGMEMQLFLLRWVRLLFCQIFPPQVIKMMWDVIFAFSGRLSLVDHICVVLIILQRGKLLEGDLTHAYSVLFNYPIEEYSPDLILNLALASCMWFELPLIRNLDFKQRVRVKESSSFWGKVKTEIVPVHAISTSGSRSVAVSPPLTPKLKAGNQANILDKFFQIEDHLNTALILLENDPIAAKEVKNALVDIIKLKNDIQSEENFFVMF
ncbi:hypothetical protein EIN_062690 [Entamoeba invadens IP1]|uniref:hypothetical protein n=1 Tax=Entamoeba invadens IP1 TaxID=370355 RepID=UPI0002C3CE0F|nr:hypothetical protein EIN_062690 [Entamoeba invadens IP1]ELP93574.1 hypothetical protein EIN_062690 [Entamoeba invadens IP1]|eukprot:XP_004260345.1 hypothetical protein EIN_062690 [Entamoeba invadens IP1]